MRRCLAALAILVSLAACAHDPAERSEPPAPEGQARAAPPSDLVVTGRIHTLDDAVGTVEAMLTRHGVVMAVGPLKEIEALARPDAVRIQVPAGSVVLPGIIESHAHLLGIGAGLRKLDLRPTRSVEEVLALVAAALPGVPPGQWLEGRGWNQETWPDARFPDRELLDRVAPDVPVVLTRVDGHALWANSAALRAARLSKDTRAPAGGEILRRPDREPTGVFIDNAMSLVTAARPPQNDPALVERDVLAAQELALSLGITTLVDAGTAPETLAVLERLDGVADPQKPRLKMRFYCMHSADSIADVRRITSRPPRLEKEGRRLVARAVKMYADGALGSRGAWLLEPYADRAGHTGLPVTPPAQLREAASLCLENGYQLCVHAIGDRANREVLDAVHRALSARGEAGLDHRFRIEHAQIVHPDDAPRFAQLGMLPSIQTCHAASDADMARARLGEERRRTSAYVWRNLLDTGVVLPNGTDAPVEPLSPWINLHAAVFREHLGARNAFDLPQRLTRKEALLSMTAWGAHGTFAEHRRGRLSPGHDADFVILDRDPLAVPAAELPQIGVRATFVAGEPSYYASGQPAVAQRMPWDPSACACRAHAHEHPHRVSGRGVALRAP